MSKYTTEVRYICESANGLRSSVGADKVDEVIAGALEKVFNFDFPIFDEAYRKVIETKILKHYYTREISEETVGLWKLRLNSRLNEIMPYYNQLYKSELLEFNPLYTKNLTRDYHVSSEDHTTANGGGTSWNLYSDTPQGGLKGVAENSYLTTADKTTSDSNSRADTNGTNEYLEHVMGFEGVNPSKMLKDFRDTFLNIDMMIIKDLEDLFFQLW